MMIFDSSLGIDFRQNQLILTFLRRSLGRIRLVDYGLYPISSEGAKEDWEAQTLNLINPFISKHEIDKKRISISIPREKVVVRFIRFPIATKENLRKVLEYEAPKYTPFEKGETYFDYHIFKEEKEWLHLFVVFVKKDEVDRYLSLLKKIGIQPTSIQIPSTAALNLFFYNGGVKEKETSVLLDVAAPFLEMNLLRQGSLIESLHLPFSSDEKASKIIHSLKRTGMKWDSLAVSNFFVYGLGADDGVLASLKEAGQIQNVFFPSLKRIGSGEKASTLYQIYPSLGVSLRGLTKTHMDLNLLPFEMRKKVRQFGKPLFITLSIVALILGMTWGAGGFIRYRDELNVVNGEIRKRKPAVEAVEKLQKQKEELAKEISDLKKIEMGEASKVEILRELAQLLPDVVWIWNFKYNGKEIEISGFAESASDLIPLLDKSPLFEKVEFLGPVTKERMMRGNESKEKERFKIKMKIELRRS